MKGTGWRWRVALNPVREDFAGFRFWESGECLTADEKQLLTWMDRMDRTKRAGELVLKISPDSFLENLGGSGRGIPSSRSGTAAVTDRSGSAGWLWEALIGPAPRPAVSTLPRW